MPPGQRTSEGGDDHTPFFRPTPIGGQMHLLPAVKTFASPLLNPENQFLELGQVPCSTPRNQDTRIELRLAQVVAVPLHEVLGSNARHVGGPALGLATLRPLQYLGEKGVPGGPESPGWDRARRPFEPDGSMRLKHLGPSLAIGEEG